LNAERIAKSVVSMLQNDRSEIQKELDRIRQKLDSSGPDPYEKASNKILEFLEHTYGPLPKTP
jgi:hypothetical protein